MTAPKMIPESIFGVVRDAQEQRFHCVDCMLTANPTPLAEVYVVSGTLLCSAHAQLARQKELQR